MALRVFAERGERLGGVRLLGAGDPCLQDAADEVGVGLIEGRLRRLGLLLGDAGEGGGVLRLLPLLGLHAEHLGRGLEHVPLLVVEDIDQGGLDPVIEEAAVDLLLEHMAPEKADHDGEEEPEEAQQSAAHALCGRRIEDDTCCADDQYVEKPPELCSHRAS